MLTPIILAYSLHEFTVGESDFSYCSEYFFATIFKNLQNYFLSDDFSDRY